MSLRPLRFQDESAILPLCKLDNGLGAASSHGIFVETHQVDGFLEKPVEPGTLPAEVQKLLIANKSGFILQTEKYFGEPSQKQD